MRALGFLALALALCGCESAADRQARELADYRAQNARDIALARETALCLTCNNVESSDETENASR